MHPVMQLESYLKCLCVVAFAVFSSACLTRRTVTQNGETVKSDYVFTRPLKNAVQNSN
jgi:hypothetical protein